MRLLFLLLAKKWIIFHILLGGYFFVSRSLSSLHFLSSTMSISRLDPEVLFRVFSELILYWNSVPYVVYPRFRFGPLDDVADSIALKKIARVNESNLGLRLWTESSAAETLTNKPRSGANHKLMTQFFMQLTWDRGLWRQLQGGVLRVTCRM